MSNFLDGFDFVKPNLTDFPHTAANKNEGRTVEKQTNDLNQSRERYNSTH